MQTSRRYAPLGGSFAPVRVVAFKWNGWQASAVYALIIIAKLLSPGGGRAVIALKICY